MLLWCCWWIGKRCGFRGIYVRGIRQLSERYIFIGAFWLLRGETQLYRRYPDDCFTE